jgi:Zinc carboxypeptidase
MTSASFTSYNQNGNTGRRRWVAAAASILSVALIFAGSYVSNPAEASPVKCAEGDVTLDDRVFPEPRMSGTFLRFDEFECGIKFLEKQHSKIMEVTKVGKSRGGFPLYNVLLTNESVPAKKKKKLLVVSSIHGNEVGGREGAVRCIEDMVDERFLANEKWVKKVLDKYVIHFLFPNPDGWVAGDIAGTPGAGIQSTRGNGDGLDLNRQFPVTGYINRGNHSYSQPEAKDIASALFGTKEKRDDWFLGTDNHGQGPDTYAAAGLQIVGQFDYQKSETLARFADGITGEMTNYSVLDTLGTLNEASGQDIGPYHWGTLYDMLGYSASGSLIDYYNTATKTDGWGFATELTVGSEVNMAAHGGLLNQVYVDSIRAINYTMFKQAIEPKKFTYKVEGKAAYVFDPEVITDRDKNGPGFFDPNADPKVPQEHYRVTRMKFFSDLNKYATNPLAKLRVSDVEKGKNLGHFDSIVLANDSMPGKANAKKYFGNLEKWVEAGGNLIVTDAAVDALVEMGLIDKGSVSVTKHYVGSVEEFIDREHPLNANLRGVASQTFDTVPIGYAFDSEGDSAPNWKIDQAAWEEAGGYTAGTNGEGQTIYGHLPVKKGHVRFLGALLPDPTEKYYHPYGLQNYAVTYTGYTLLQNMLNAK